MQHRHHEFQKSHSNLSDQPPPRRRRTSRGLSSSPHSSSSLLNESHLANSRTQLLPPTTSSQLQQKQKMNQQQQQQQHSSTAQTHNNNNTTSSIPPFVIKATAIASLGGILFGYDMGIISTALPQLTTALDLSDRQQEVVVGILYLGGGVGAAVGGSLCDSLGRWTAIVLTDVCFLVGATILMWSPTVTVLCVGRIVMGLAISVSGIADVAYLHELAPVQYRGAIVSVNEACISLGFLLAYVSGFVLSGVHQVHGWRAMFGLGGVMALVQLVGMLTLMPESPVWLREQHRWEEAHRALCVIYGSEEAIPAGAELGDEEEQDGGSNDGVNQNNAEETRRAGEHARMRSVSGAASSLPSPTSNKKRKQMYESIEISSKNYVEEQEGDDMTQGDGGLSYPSSSCNRRAAFCTRQVMHTLRTFYRYRKQAYIALFLSVAQQLSGQTIVLNYAPFIFSQLGSSSLATTLWIGLVKFLMTVLVIWKIEQLGRRFLLLSGMAVTVFGLILVTCAFSTGLDVQQESPLGGGMFWALPGVLCVVTGYSASFGPLTWLLTSELVPTDIRGRALGMSTIVTYLCASLVTSTFLSAQAAMGAEQVFGLYAGLTWLGMIYAYLAIPDTGGKSVAEIEETLLGMWWWRRRGRGGAPAGYVFSSYESDAQEEHPVPASQGELT